MKLLNKKDTQDFFSELEETINKANLDYALEAVRQYKIGHYKADFYYPEYNLVLEVDGRKWHAQSAEHKDRERDQFMLKEGFTVVRAQGSLVFKNPHGILQVLKYVPKNKVTFINTDDDLRAYQLVSLEMEEENERIARINNWG